MCSALQRLLHIKFAFSLRARKSERKRNKERKRDLNVLIDLKN
jgi:hypothetical protein